MFRLNENARSGNLFLEILMIVVGINVALWFENWFQDLENADIEAQYMADLRDDLVTDMASLDDVLAASEAKLERTAQYMELLPTIAKLPPQEQAQAIYTPANYQYFVPSDFTFRAMQESGDFRLLRNRDIKKSILRLNRRHADIELLQTNYLQALDDGYIPLMMHSFDISTLTVTDPGLFDNQLFRNFFVYTSQDTRAMLAAYRSARSQSEALVALIDAALAD
ncbi:MAG: DUF6090 family protein [Pseudomonadota bacterium]